MDKRIIAFAVIAIVALVVAIVSLGVAFTVLSESHPSTSTPAPTSTEPTIAPTATPQPTPTPTATPNLSSAKPDTANRISINVTAYNTASIPEQYAPTYFIYLKNNGASSITILSIVATSPTHCFVPEGNFTYWSGNQVIAPNAFGQVNNQHSDQSGVSMVAIYVYYEVSGQVFCHSFVPAPAP